MEHEWITDTNVTLEENEILEVLNYEIEVHLPTPVGPSVVLSTDEPQP